MNNPVNFKFIKDFYTHAVQCAMGSQTWSEIHASFVIAPLK